MPVDEWSSRTMQSTGVSRRKPIQVLSRRDLDILNYKRTIHHRLAKFQIYQRIRLFGRSESRSFTINFTSVYSRTSLATMKRGEVGSRPPIALASPQSQSPFMGHSPLVSIHRGFVPRHSENTKILT